MTAADIARALGGHRAGREWLARCPCHEDGTPSLSIRDRDGNPRPLVHCFAGCDPCDIIRDLQRQGLWTVQHVSAPRRSPPPIRRHDDEAQRRRKAVHRIWRAAHDPRGTLAEKYLASREITLDDDLCGRVIRFHPACMWGSGARLPCLIAGFSPILADPGSDAPPVAILRVGLDEHGGKIGRKMLGPVGGAAIKIDADEHVTLAVGVCEGLETGLAIRATWRPVWALGSAGAIRMLAPIDGIEAITIFADHDRNGVGFTVAYECAERWSGAGREAFIRMPRRVGADWADQP
jgi:putative DNA primase/helicase